LLFHFTFNKNDNMLKVYESKRTYTYFKQELLNQQKIGVTIIYKIKILHLFLVAHISKIDRFHKLYWKTIYTSYFSSRNLFIFPFLTRSLLNIFMYHCARIKYFSKLYVNQATYKIVIKKSCRLSTPLHSCEKIWFHNFYKLKIFIISEYSNGTVVRMYNLISVYTFRCCWDNMFQALVSIQ